MSESDSNKGNEKKHPTKNNQVKRKLPKKSVAKGQVNRRKKRCKKSRICANGKPMPPLAELEKMWNDDEEPTSVKIPQSSVTITEKQPEVQQPPERFEQVKTPDISGIPALDEVLSPNTFQQISSSIKALFPNGPPPPRPIVPVKKRKKSDTPYIVGCTSRPQVITTPSLNVFKGDNYGIYTNNYTDDEEEDCIPKKKARNVLGLSTSKSLFNAQSSEIVEKLKTMENFKDTDNQCIEIPYMSSHYSNSYRQAFSPLPSTSKDSETILKNEQNFKESLQDNTYFDDEDDDDDDLPDISFGRQNHHKKINALSFEEKYNIKLSNLCSATVVRDTNEYNQNDELDIIEINSNNNEPQFKNSMRIGNDKSKSTVIINKSDHDLVQVKEVCSSSLEKTVCKNKFAAIDANHNSIQADEMMYVHSSINNHDHDETATDKYEVVDLDKYLADVEAYKNKYDKQDKLVEVNNSNNNYNNSDVQFISEIPVSHTYRPSTVNRNTESSAIGLVINKFFNGDMTDYNAISMESINPCIRDFIKNSCAHYKAQSIQKPRKTNSNKKGLNDTNQNKIENNNNAPSTSTCFTNSNTVRNLGSCPICMENLDVNSIASTICGHIFCMECIKKSVKISGKKCPTCRKSLKGVGYHQIFLAS